MEIFDHLSVVHFIGQTVVLDVKVWITVTDLIHPKVVKSG